MTPLSSKRIGLWWTQNWFIGFRIVSQHGQLKYKVSTQQFLKLRKIQLIKIEVIKIKILKIEVIKSEVIKIGVRKIEVIKLNQIISITVEYMVLKLLKSLTIKYG